MAVTPEIEVRYLDQPVLRVIVVDRLGKTVDS